MRYHPVRVRISLSAQRPSVLRRAVVQAPRGEWFFPGILISSTSQFNSGWGYAIQGNAKKIWSARLAQVSQRPYRVSLLDRVIGGCGFKSHPGYGKIEYL